MAKYVIHTVSQFYNRYYVEVKDPEWAGDSIVMNDLEPFASTHMGENVLNYEKVKKWPKVDRADINGAGYECEYEEDGSFKRWHQLTLWDYAK